jgi:RNA polymerase sigma-70 factor, ECF subfamily
VRPWPSTRNVPSEVVRVAIVAAEVAGFADELLEGDGLPYALEPLALPVPEACEEVEPLDPLDPPQPATTSATAAASAGRARIGRGLLEARRRGVGEGWVFMSFEDSVPPPNLPEGSVRPTRWCYSGTFVGVPRLDSQALVQHVDRLYRAAWALCGSREDAEDLVQETYARVLAKPRRLRGDDELAYLMRALRNTFLTSRRTASRRPRADVGLDEIAAVDPRSGARPDEAAETQEVFAAIAALPEDFRLALVAVDVAGLSYREAAKVLHAREATLATRVFRARAQVAAALGHGDPEPVRDESAAVQDAAGSP